MMIRRAGRQWVYCVLLLLVLVAASMPIAAAQADSDAALTEQRIAAAQPSVRDSLMLAEAFLGTGPLPRVARSTPLEVALGQTERFWVGDPATGVNRQIEATLRYRGPVVLMYVDTSIEVDQVALERSANLFEQRIYRRNRAMFGSETAPGIDGDQRLTILNTRLRGAGGYFSPADGVVRAANRFSNERDMFVIDLGSFPLGTNQYAATLAHEFQHMIHESRQPGAATWFDEGMATIAEDINGYTADQTPSLYLADPDLPLLDWSPTGAHYGMARLFLRYMLEEYRLKPADLIAANAGNDLAAFVAPAARVRPDIKDFGDLLADWAVANLLNDPQIERGRYAYRLLPRTVNAEALNRTSLTASVSQYGVDYLELPGGPHTVVFKGATRVALNGTTPYQGRLAWWSNRGDQRVATLTRAIDLRSVKRATLSFQTWYELERGYDYGFVSISQDAGRTWRTLTTASTTTDDPQGYNYGAGFTGISGVAAGELGATTGRWVAQQADLTPYAGSQVLLRFWAITDAAVNGPGMLLDAIRIPELGLVENAEQDDRAWQAQGFVRVGSQLPQHWELRLVRYGTHTSVERVAVDSNGRASVQLRQGEHGVLVVIGTQRHTSELARYTLQLVRGG